MPADPMTHPKTAMEAWQAAQDAEERVFAEEMARTDNGVLASAFGEKAAASVLEAWASERERARVVEDGMHTVPLQPTEDQWGGVARAIMMAFDMNCKTPRQIFQHLERTLREVPQWLRDEPEMKHLDHVPSKGTRCAIIYKAMLLDYRHADQGEGL